MSIPLPGYIVMDETTQMTDEEYDAVVAIRVRKIGLIVVGGALLLIALSTLTLKADQTNQIPRSSIGGMPVDKVPQKPVDPVAP